MVGVFDSDTNIVGNGLVCWLDAAQRRSYPGSGSVWTDISGNNKDMAMVNGPTFTTQNGGAIVFDGVDDYSQGSQSNTFGIGQNVTIEVVGNLTAAGGTQWAFWFGGVSTDRGISAHLNESGEIIFDTMGWGTSDTRMKYSPSPAVGTTNWYAFRYKDDTTPYKHIFLNGTAVANSATNAQKPLNLSTDAAKVPGNAYNIYYNGLILLFRVYNRALSDEELLTNYYAEKIRYNI